MEVKGKNHLKEIIEIVVLLLTIIGFILNDYDKLKQNSMWNYIIEHWNWWLMCVIFIVIIRLIRILIREDIKDTHEKIIQGYVNLQEKFIPDLVMNNIFIREVLMSNIDEEKLYKTLEFNVFEEGKFNIPQLEKFGIDSKYIKRLRKEYLNRESKKIQED